MQRGEEEGAGVVDSGVDVEDHGQARHCVGRHGVDCVGAPVERRQHAVRAEGRAACCLLSSSPARSRAALGASQGAHVPSTGAARDVSTPPDPPLGRHHRRPDRAGPDARRVRGRPRRAGHVRRDGQPEAVVLRTLVAGQRVRNAERDAEHGIPLAQPGRRGRVRHVDDRGHDARAAAGPAVHGRLRRQRLARLARRTRARARHVGNVIYLGGWDGAAKVNRTSEHLQGLVSGKSTGDVGLLIAADQEGGEVHQLRGAGFTRPPSAKQQATMSSAAAHPGRHGVGPRAQGRRRQRQPRPGHRHGARGHRPRQRADRALRAAVRLGPRDGRAGLGRVPQGDAGRRRRGHGQALPRPGPDPQQHRLQQHRHHRRRDRRRRPLPAAVRGGRRGRGRPGHGRLGALQQARPEGAGDVLGTDRHRPAARRPRLRRRRHHRRRQRPGGARHARPPAGGAVHRRRRRHRAHRPRRRARPR